ncbi:MAG: hypothetical protein ACLU9S_10830 [Oscillospiraceae bacterium]
MKMDGTSKRKLSKRKDPELALHLLQGRGASRSAPCTSMSLTLLNSNYEDWRRANPTAQPRDDFTSPAKAEPGQARCLTMPSSATSPKTSSLP